MIVLITLAVVMTVVFLFWSVNAKRKKAADTVPQYICSHCGEKHCDCHRDSVASQGPGNS